MTYDQEIVADLVAYGTAAAAFGIWQGSFFAGVFAFLMLLEWKATKE